MAARDGGERVSTTVDAEQLEAALTAITITDEEGEARQALPLARGRLGLPTLCRVIKRGRVNALYDLELEDGTIIELGPIGHLRDPRRVEEAIADVTGHFPPYYSRPKFGDIANALLALAEIVDDGETPRTTTGEWVAELLDRGWARIVDLDDPQQRSEAIAGAFAFRAADGRIYLRLQELERHVRLFLRIPTTRRDLTARLQRLGFEQHRLLEVHARRDQGERRVRRYWRSPIGWDADEHTTGV
jgi:hypothetical protein